MADIRTSIIIDTSTAKSELISLEKNFNKLADAVNKAETNVKELYSETSKNVFGKYKQDVNETANLLKNLQAQIQKVKATATGGMPLFSPTVLSSMEQQISKMEKLSKGTFWGGMTASIQKNQESIKKLNQDLRSIFNAMPVGSVLGEKISGGINKAFTSIKSQMTNMGATISGGFSSSFSKVNSVAETAWQKVKSIFSKNIPVNITANTSALASIKTISPITNVGNIANLSAYAGVYKQMVPSIQQTVTATNKETSAVQGLIKELNIMKTDAYKITGKMTTDFLTLNAATNQAVQTMMRFSTLPMPVSKLPVGSVLASSIGTSIKTGIATGFSGTVAIAQTTWEKIKSIFVKPILVNITEGYTKTISQAQTTWEKIKTTYNKPITIITNIGTGIIAQAHSIWEKIKTEFTIPIVQEIKVDVSPVSPVNLREIYDKNISQAFANYKEPANLRENYKRDIEQFNKDVANEDEDFMRESRAKFADYYTQLQDYQDGYENKSRHSYDRYYEDLHDGYYKNLTKMKTANVIPIQIKDNFSKATILAKETWTKIKATLSPYIPIEVKNNFASNVALAQAASTKIRAIFSKKYTAQMSLLEGKENLGGIIGKLFSYSTNNSNIIGSISGGATIGLIKLGGMAKGIFGWVGLALQGIQKVFYGVSTFVGRMMVLIYPLSMVLRPLIKEYNDYSIALMKMEQVVTDGTKTRSSQVQAYAQDVSKLNVNLGSETQLLSGLYQVYSAGVGILMEHATAAEKDAKQMEIMTSTAKAAKVGGIEQGQVVKGVTAVMFAYRDSVDTAEKATDLMFKMAAVAKTEFSELIPVIGTTANMASKAGVSINDMAGSLTLLTQYTGTTAEAATQMEALMTGLINPTKDMEALMKKFGGVQKAIQDYGFVNVLKAISTATGGTVENLTKLLGRKEAIQGFFALTQNNFKDLTAYIREMGDTTGYSQTLFNDWEKTFAGVWTTFKQSLANTFKNLFEQVAPYFQRLLQLFTKMLDDSKGNIGVWGEMFINTVNKMYLRVLDFYKGLILIQMGLLDIIRIVKQLFDIVMFFLNVIDNVLLTIPSSLIKGLGVVGVWLLKLSRIFGTDEQKSEMTKLQAEYDSASQRILDAETAINKIRQEGIDQENILIEGKKINNKYQEDINKLLEQQNEYLSMGGKETDEQYKNTKNRISLLKDTQATEQILIGAIYKDAQTKRTFQNAQQWSEYTDTKIMDVFTSKDPLQVEIPLSVSIKADIVEKQLKDLLPEIPSMLQEAVKEDMPNFYTNFANQNTYFDQMIDNLKKSYPGFTKELEDTMRTAYIEIKKAREKEEKLMNVTKMGGGSGKTKISGAEEAKEIEKWQAFVTQQRIKSFEEEYKAFESEKNKEFKLDVNMGVLALKQDKEIRDAKIKRLNDELDLYKGIKIEDIKIPIEIDSKSLNTKSLEGLADNIKGMFKGTGISDEISAQVNSIIAVYKDEVEKINTEKWDKPEEIKAGRIRDAYKSLYEMVEKYKDKKIDLTQKVTELSKEEVVATDNAKNGIMESLNEMGLGFDLLAQKQKDDLAALEYGMKIVNLIFKASNQTPPFSDETINSAVEMKGALNAVANAKKELDKFAPMIDLIGYSWEGTTNALDNYNKAQWDAIKKSDAYKKSLEKVKQLTKDIFDLQNRKTTRDKNAGIDVANMKALYEEMNPRKSDATKQILEGFKEFGDESDAFGATFALWTTDVVNTGQWMATEITKSFDGMTEGIGNAFAQSLVYGEDWGDAMAAMTRSVTASFIQDVVKRGAEWLAKELFYESAVTTIKETGATTRVGVTEAEKLATFIADSGGNAVLLGEQSTFEVTKTATAEGGAIARISASLGELYAKTAALFGPWGPAIAAGVVAAAVVGIMALFKHFSGGGEEEAAASTVPSMEGVQTKRGDVARGMFHSGIDVVPETGTYLLKGGERVIQPEQNVVLGKFLEQYDKVSNLAGSTKEIVTKNMPEEQTVKINFETTKFDTFFNKMKKLENINLNKGIFTAFDKTFVDTPEFIDDTKNIITMFNKEINKVNTEKSDLSSEEKTVEFVKFFKQNYKNDWDKLEEYKINKMNVANQNNVELYKMNASVMTKPKVVETNILPEKILKENIAMSELYKINMENDSEIVKSKLIHDKKFKKDWEDSEIYKINKVNMENWYKAETFKVNKVNANNWQTYKVSKPNTENWESSDAYKINKTNTDNWLKSEEGLTVDKKYKSIVGLNKERKEIFGTYSSEIDKINRMSLDNLGKNKFDWDKPNITDMTKYVLESNPSKSSMTYVPVAHKGVDNVPETGLNLLKKGERVVQSEANVSLTKFLADNEKESKKEITQNITINAPVSFPNITNVEQLYNMGSDKFEYVVAKSMRAGIRKGLIRGVDVTVLP